MIFLKMLETNWSSFLAHKINDVLEAALEKEVSDTKNEKYTLQDVNSATDQSTERLIAKEK